MEPPQCRIPSMGDESGSRGACPEASSSTAQRRRHPGRQKSDQGSTPPPSKNFTTIRPERDGVGIYSPASLPLRTSIPPNRGRRLVLGAAPIFLTFAGVFRNDAPVPSQRALSKTHGVLPRRKNRQLLDGRSGRGTRGCWPLDAGSRRITACQTANTTEAKEKPPERGGLEAKYRVHRRVIERGRTSPHRRTVASGRGGQERNPGFPQPEALVVPLPPASDRPCIALPVQCRDRVPRALYAFY